MTKAKPKTSRRREKRSPPASPLTEHERIDLLLDEALQGTFPASDPVAIGVGRLGKGTSTKRR
jgi:hypothetical protein